MREEGVKPVLLVLCIKIYFMANERYEEKFKKASFSHRALQSSVLTKSDN